MIRRSEAGPQPSQKGTVARSMEAEGAVEGRKLEVEAINHNLYYYFDPNMEEASAGLQ